MKTSEAGFAFIRREEGLVLKAQPDVGKMAIGYGHDLLPGESYPHGIDKEEAEALLVADVAKVEQALDKLFPSLGTQNQYDSLIDFGYNLGVTSLSVLFSHPFVEFPRQLLRWCYVREHGVHEKSEALLARRKREVELFCS